MICFHNITNKTEHYHCLYCNNVVHRTCYSQWWGIDGEDKTNKHCIYCSHTNGLVLKNRSKWRDFKIWFYRYFC